ncbi:uncharacterized protein LOC135502364 [Lineus longissimus]|uniref:uncharacterized protein LOC135502364 n=1 Tax=Lineus longissimus TaxID=88925 RepID=UPI00315D0C57
MKLLLILVLSVLQLEETLLVKTITNTISNLRPLIGETITLSCNTSGGPFIDVVWWKNKHRDPKTVLTYNCIVVAEDYTSRLTNRTCDTNNFDFQLRNVQISDSGIWECGTQSLSSTTRPVLDVLVPVPPQKPRVTNPSPIIVGKTAKFTCNAENENVTKPVTYTWTKNGDTVSPGTIERGALLFSPVKKSDAGKYVCVAKNDAGSMTSTEQVLVVYLPVLPQKPRVTNPSPIIVGKTAKFTCNAENENVTKPVTYTWTKNGDAVSPGTIGTGALLFSPVKESDAGKYVCVAKNYAGTKASTEQVLVVYPPHSAPSKLKVVNTTAVAVTLEWISEFNGGSKQRFYVQYKKSVDNWDVAADVPQGGITDPGLKKAVYHKVMGLESNVGYMFRVRSKNSDPGTHTSKFSNITSGKTLEKPQTSHISVSRTDNKVTVRWKQVTGKYTAIKVNYCEIDTGDCMNYTVPNPEDNHATFFLDANRTYYYHLIIVDGGDVVYTSTGIKDGINDESYLKVVDDKTSVAVLGGLVGAVIIAIAGMTGVIVAVVLWKRGLVCMRWGNGQSHRPANDTADNNGTRVEFTTMNSSVQIYNDIGTEQQNDVVHAASTTGQNPAESTGHHAPANEDFRNESTSSDDDVNAYDYAFSLTTWKPGVSVQSPVSVRQANRAEPEDATHYEVMQRELETEYTYNQLPILKLEQRDQSTTESGLGKADVAKELTPSRSSDDVADGRDSPYAHLDRVESVKAGEYLDFAQLSPEQLRPM